MALSSSISYLRGEICNILVRMVHKKLRTQKNPQNPLRVEACAAIDNIFTGSNQPDW